MELWAGDRDRVKVGKQGLLSHKIGAHDAPSINLFLIYFYFYLFIHERQSGRDTGRGEK